MPEQEKMVDSGYDIYGNRLYLRKIRLQDAGGTYERWLNDPQVNQYMETRHSKQTIPQIKAYIAALENADDATLYAVCLKKKHRHIGNIKLGPVNRIHGYADVSLFIGEKSCWGMGYASEAIGLICTIAFERLNLNKLIAGCYETNTGSKKAFEKVGFVVEGVMKSMFRSKGQYVDCFFMSILQERWHRVEKRS